MGWRKDACLSGYASRILCSAHGDNQQRMDEIAKVNNRKSILDTMMRGTVYERMVALRNLALIAEVAAMQTDMAQIGLQRKKLLISLQCINMAIAEVKSLVPQNSSIRVRKIKLLVVFTRLPHLRNFA